MDIKNQIQRIIDKRRQKLTKERDEYEAKMRDTESYYGFGGPYMRQEAARDKRDKQLEELEDFEKQLKATTRHIETKLYVFGCRECGTVTLTTKQPLDAWHECPSCRQMIYLDKIKPQKILIAENEECWQEMLKESLEEAGR